MKKTKVFMAAVAALGLMAVPAGAAMTDRAQEECAAAPNPRYGHIVQYL